MKNFLIILSVAFAFVTFTVPTFAQTILFQDQMTDPNAWGVNKSVDPDSSATFGYDYSTDGIPEAPNTQSGDTATAGVKLEANNGDANANAAFLTIYPTGQNFTGDYVLEFDMWMNYSTVDREDNAGAGTTEFLGGGIGYDGVSADVVSGAQSIVTNEGGSGSDYRSFKDGYYIDHVDMIAGSRNATGAHTNYTDFFPKGSGAPPASQNQSPADPNTNFNRAGSPGFQWVTWQISVLGNKVRTEIEKPNGENLGIVVYDKTDTSDGSSGVGTDGNISIFYADFFLSITTKPELTFGIVDNVVVSEAIGGDFDFDGDVDGTDFLRWQRGAGSTYDGDDLVLWEANYGMTAAVANVVTVPEPTSIALLVLGAMAISTCRRWC